MFFRNHHHTNLIVNHFFRTTQLLQNSIAVSNYFKQQQFQIHSSQICFKFIPDKSRFPALNENDIEEQFVQGSGPGGQNVNRLQNCVILKHLPTGIIVKCHQERLLQRNRKLARQLLLQRLDVHYNGTDSIVEQKKRYILSRLEQREQRFSYLRMKKLQYQKIFQQQRQKQQQQQQESDYNEN